MISVSANRAAHFLQHHHLSHRTNTISQSVRTQPSWPFHHCCTGVSPGYRQRIIKTMDLLDLLLLMISINRGPYKNTPCLMCSKRIICFQARPAGSKSRGICPRSDFASTGTQNPHSTLVHDTMTTWHSIQQLPITIHSIRNPS